MKRALDQKEQQQPPLFVALPLLHARSACSDLLSRQGASLDERACVARVHGADRVEEATR